MTENKEPKTLEFKWEYGDRELAIQVSTYMANNGLYIGLASKDEEFGIFEPFSDLTTNVGGGCKPNEAFIVIEGGLLNMTEFIKQHGLGEMTEEYRNSGFNLYQKVVFDMEKLRELDSEGVENHLKIHNNKMEVNPKANVNRGR